MLKLYVSSGCRYPVVVCTFLANVCWNCMCPVAVDICFVVCLYVFVCHLHVVYILSVCHLHVVCMSNTCCLYVTCNIVSVVICCNVIVKQFSTWSLHKHVHIGFLMPKKCEGVHMCNIISSAYLVSFEESLISVFAKAVVHGRVPHLSQQHIRP